MNKKEIKSFIELANSYHPTIKFMAETSDREITSLDTCVYKGERLRKESILEVRTHFKPTETSQYTHSPPAPLQASGEALSKAKP